MKPLTANDPETKSPDLVAANLAALRTLFPELVTEGPDGVSVNSDVLKQLVGDKTITDTEEKYGLNWHGKRRARQLALSPSSGTLLPCPEESVDWDTTQNLMIEGDNLEVLKLLQKSYAGKVKLIYIDPPYNTGKDFIYPDNYQDNIKNYLELTGQTGEGGRKLSSNTEASGRFHTDWLNMMYPRLKLARNLLRDDGVILLSIDDNEIENVRTLCDEVFGEENFCAQITVVNNLKGRNDRKHVATCHEYLVAYAKSESAELSGLPLTDEQRAEYKHVDSAGEKYTLRDLRKRGRPDRREDRPNMWYPIYFNQENKKCSLTRYSPDDFEITPKRGDGSDGRWRWGKERVAANLEILEPRFSNRNDRWDIDHRVYLKTATDSSDGEDDLDEENGEERSSKSKSFWVGGELSTDVGRRSLKELIPESEYDYPKAVEFIKRCIHIGSNISGTVVDFFAGSGTLGQAVMEVNSSLGGQRHFILVQMPENLVSNQYDTIADITKERLRRTGKKIKAENPLFAGDLGFRVFKLASSNIRAWDPDRDKFAETLEASIEHLKTDRTEQDILFELLLKWGIDLCTPIESRNISGHTVHSIGSGTLLTCLSPAIPQAQVEALALGIVVWYKELAPTIDERKARDTVCIFRDSAFADDVAKTNLTAILHQHGLETVRSL